MNARRFFLGAVSGILLCGVIGAGPFPQPGVTKATTPLHISGNTVYETQADKTHDGYLTAADWVLFSNGTGGGGGGSGTTVTSSVTGALSTCATNYPIDNTPPTTAEGCLIASVSVTPSTSASVLSIFAEATVGATNTGTHAACWITVGSDPAHAISQSYLSGGATNNQLIAVMWSTTAGSTSSRTYGLYCAGDAVNMSSIKINADYGGNAEFGGAFATGIWVTEYGTGGGGGGGMTDPYTGNGWTPASGTATVTGDQNVTGALAAASLATGAITATSVAASGTVSGSSVSGTTVSASTSVTSPLYKTTTGHMILQSQGGYGVKVPTSLIGSKTACTSAEAGTIIYSIDPVTLADHFLGCKKTGGATFVWSQLDN